jgi:DNA-binding winged helix-turn-helix (wHTH) protein/DNA-binding CsgD family transcriptional regulator
MKEEGIYLFDHFMVDTKKHILLKDGEHIHVTPKAFDLLVVLLGADGCLVSHSELMDRVWADRCVEESNVSQTISMLRRALQDGNGNGGGPCISTIWGRGYRIAADIRRISRLDREGPGASRQDFNGLGRSQHNGHGLPRVAMTSQGHVEWMDRLTPSERRVLEMIAGDRISRDIARELRISVRTVENHRAKIRDKLGLCGPNALLRFAVEHREQVLGRGTVETGINE